MSYSDEPNKNPLQCLKPSHNLWFNKDTHTYFRGRRPVGSVTQVLKATGLIGNDIDFVSEDHMWKGSCIHKGIELINKMKLDWETVDDTEVYPYLKAYEQFISATGFQALLVEFPVFDPVLGIAGTLDVEGTFPSGIHAVIDVKSGTVKPWARIQLSGYDYLLQSEFPTAKPRERYALELKGGKPKVVRFGEAEQDRGIFLAACSVFNWRLNHGHRK
jgi:hypothetical protein